MDARVALLLAAAVLATAATPSPADAGIGAREARSARPAAACAATAPVAFTGNAGQWDPRVRFAARARGYRALLCAEGLVFRAATGPGTAAGLTESVVRFRVAGGVAWAAGARLPGTASYFLGRGPSAWRTGIATFGGATGAASGGGVSLSVSGTATGSVAYEFRVAPGVDPGRAEFAVEGARRVAIDADGALRVDAANGSFRHSAPILHQEAEGARVAVSGAFQLRPGNRVGFRVGAFDRTLPLVIDPVVSFTAYNGGTAEDSAEAIAVGDDGGILLAGRTLSTDYPVTSPGSEIAGGDYDIGVTLLGAGGAVAWSTYLGGASTDLGTCVALGPGGEAFVGGYTYSDDFPLQGPLDASFAAESQAFLLRLDASGTELAFSTYLGGETKMGNYPPRTVVRSMARDAAGRIVVTGETTTTDMPTTDGALQETAGGDDFDAFLACIEGDGSALAWCTYLGGAGDEKGTDLALAPDGSILVVGSQVKSTEGFPVLGGVPGLNLSNNAGSFFAKVAADGSSLVWSWLLRHGSTTYATCVGAAPDGSMYAAGTTRGVFPATAGAMQTSRAGTNDNEDAFLLRTNAAGDALVFATYLGGSWDDLAEDLVVTPGGEAIVYGSTLSSTFPVSGSLHGYLGGQDAFLARVLPDGSALRYGTYLGTTTSEYAFALAWREGRAYAVGGTYGDDLPGSGVLPSVPAGDLDGFVTVFDFTPTPPSGLEGTPIPGPSIVLSWEDASDDETGFEVQRREGEDPWVTVVEEGPGATMVLDTGLDPVTAYEYRVRAVNEDGPSAWSAVVEVTTLDRVPAPLQGLAAPVVGARVVTLAWTNAATNETGVEVLRATGGAGAVAVATLGADATGWTDEGVQPGVDYRYSVRAFNGVGYGMATADLAVRTSSTLDLVVVRGTAQDSSKTARDRLILSGTLVANDGALSPALDAVAGGVAVRFGPDDAPVLEFVVEAAATGWKARKGKATWRSPKGALPKATVVIDSRKGAFSVSISGEEFGEPPTNEAEVRIQVGDEAAVVVPAWTVKKPGLLKAR
jgi:hypothetical protein